MTTHAVRRLVTAAATTAVLAGTSVLLAGPASADTPADWPDTDPVDPMHVILLLVGVPVLLFVLIVAAVYLPALVRGESVKPGGADPVEDQWLGGPRREPSELAAPDTEASAAGGAGARW